MRPIALIIGGLILAFGLPPMPTIPTFDWPAWNVVTPVATVDRGTYFYDFRKTPVPQDIKDAFREINERDGIVFDFCDVSGDIPASYQAGRDAAQKAGLPSVVMMSGSTVAKVLHSPSGKQVTEAVR